ncbi:MAG: tRNA pseudouridine(54/55) synthase Pus10 [Sulfolobales archaeon]
MDSGVLMLASRILERYPLCDRCLGRFFAGLGMGLSNLERGRSIKVLMAMELHAGASRDPQGFRDRIYLYSLNAGEPFSSLYRHIYGLDPPKQSPCYVCGSRIESIIDEWVKRVGESLRAMGFRRFILGVRPPEGSLEAEEEIAREFSLQHWESIKNELKREIGKGVLRAYGFEPDLSDPEIMLILDIPRGSIEAVIPSLTISSKIVKLVRGISFKKRPGKRSLEDVLEKNAEDLGEGIRISIPVRDTSRYRILGDGCYSILEIKSPKPGRRNLETISRIINREQGIYIIYIIGKGRRRDIEDLADRVKRIAYRIYIYSGRELRDEEIERLKSQSPIIIEQRTPKRIVERGGAERRYIGDLRVEAIHRISERTFEIIASAPSRIYIEEAITGDEGRTSPSLSSILSADLKPLEIDVIRIEL